KSRNFRRRSGVEEVDEEDGDNPSAVPSTPAKIKGTIPSSASKSSAVNKPQKSASQSGRKSLLSFAGDVEESFSPAPTKSSHSSSSSSSLRSSKGSAHQLTSAKDRNAPHPSSSSIPSNVQPQAGTYTKETLLELQRNTRTLAAPARHKPKAEQETVVVLKGLIKPVVSSDLGGSGHDSAAHDADFDGNIDLGAENDATLTKLSGLGFEGGSEGDKDVIPDRATIEAIRAKRERLRQAKAAAPDYVALDGGSNHGAAEGLSDEEPEFRGRIGFFADKAGVHDKRGVFEDLEQRAMPRDRFVESGSDAEDEEDKMWEEEQVRKGLGKRLGNGVGGKGVTVNIAGSGLTTVHHLGGPQPTSGHSIIASSNGDRVSDAASVVGSWGLDSMSISQQADLAKKTLTTNLARLKESHRQTKALLDKNDENLSSSLQRVTTLENSLSASEEKFLFMQKLREFVSVICEFLQHKAPYIEELEEQMQKLHEEQARAIEERRQADNDDEMSEIQMARARLLKGGGSNAATAAAGHDDAPMELDEFGRDMNLQKKMDVARRSKSRQRRRARADAKRKLALDRSGSPQEMEGELSTDESETESRAHQSSRSELLRVADKIFSDAADEYSQFQIVVEKFERWKSRYASSYRDAYMSLSAPAIFSPYVRLELLKWDPLHAESDFVGTKWHSLLFNYSVREDDEDANLIPELVEKLAIPILRHELSRCWDVFSTHETRCAVFATSLIVRYVDLSSSGLADLISVLRDRLAKAVADLTVKTF
ncbi:hypothetical protein M569_01583, partial [Genlisea aurea]